MEAERANILIVNDLQRSSSFTRRFWKSWVRIWLCATGEEDAEAGSEKRFCRRASRREHARHGRF